VRRFRDFQRGPLASGLASFLFSREILRRCIRRGVTRLG
jgi:hypothetical protein